MSHVFPHQTAPSELPSEQTAFLALHPGLNDAQDILDRYLSVMPDESSFLSGLQAHLNTDQNPFSRKNMAGHLTTSALILSHAGDEVLMIHHNEHDSLQQPCGHHAGAGGLKRSALREGMEKTGLASLDEHPWTAANDCPFDIDTHAIKANPHKGEADHVHHDALFVFQADPTALMKPQLDEFSLACWFPVEVLKDCGDPRLQRVHAKLITEKLVAIPSRNMRP